MSGRDPPLFAGSILGLRAWTVEAHLPSSAVRLGSAVAEASWDPGGAWTRATCRPLGGGSPPRHRSPGAGCECGLYAFHPDTGSAGALWEAHIKSTVDHSDPCFVELAGVCGVIEAAGRLEVHRVGFRAERARPVALVAGRRWPSHAREAVEELAGLYAAEVLEATDASQVLGYCRERGGVLDMPQLDRLLEEVEEPPEPEFVAVGPGLPPPVPAGVPPIPAPVPVPDPESPRWRRAMSRAGEVLGMVVFGIFAVGWYGFWAYVVVSIVGGLLFGWFETEPERRPAKVLAVEIDRERCVISATLASRRRFKRLNLVVDGNLRNGDPLGEHNFKVGPVKRGRSRVVVARPDPRLCASRHHFTIRVRPVWGDLVGKSAEARSRYRGAAGKPPPSKARRLP